MSRPLPSDLHALRLLAFSALGLPESIYQERRYSMGVGIIDAILDQIRLAQNCDGNYSEQYLRDRSILAYWRYALPMIQHYISNKRENPVALGKLFMDLKTAVLPLKELLIEASAEGMLSAEARAAIRERWLKVTSILSNLQELPDITDTYSSTGTVASWYASLYEPMVAGYVDCQ
ncbi:hypothetical protein ACMYSQ_010158 [Aspergillus niger]